MLEADVEYTIDLTILKPGMDSEATNQTVCMDKALFPLLVLPSMQTLFVSPELMFQSNVERKDGSIPRGSSSEGN